ncbi:hypothetical protein [Thalassotalea euphylliae]|uniref:Uncharacterized protein n=1 Tax=Thalassotalea euphylliae TaxID=1655234 RepID=A0A3E0U3P1_9GAMM|nr:hypothetical protein [Thalassotalea euphylliae]REL31399.1 hypothetical protein DXX94_12115 [Thalassotalea euphylliae]
MDSFELEINEQDLPIDVKSKLEIANAEQENLGVVDNVKEVLSANFGKIVLSKVSSIIPDAYEINELSFSVSLKGELFGNGFNTQVTVKVKPVK